MSSGPELDQRLAASRAAYGLPFHVEDEALLGRLARWIADTPPDPPTTEREAAVQPVTRQKGV